MQPLGHIYTGFRPVEMQLVKDAGCQGRQYIIFTLNVGNGNTNEASSTRIWRRMGHQTHSCKGAPTKTTFKGAQCYQEYLQQAV